MDTQTKQHIPVSTSQEGSKKALSVSHPIAEMERKFEHMLERFFSPRWPSLARWNDFPASESMFDEMEVRLPSLDLVDRDNEILVRAEIPGIDKEDIDISLTDNLLTIKGETRHEDKQEKGDYHRHEISSSAFARAITLPGAVDSSKANATLKDGMLEITLPKLEASKRRTIAVK